MFRPWPTSPVASWLAGCVRACVCACVAAFAWCQSGTSLSRYSTSIELLLASRRAARVRVAWLHAKHGNMTRAGVPILHIHTYIHYMRDVCTAINESSSSSSSYIMYLYVS